MGLGDDAGLNAIKELEATALPELLAAVGKIAGELNVRLLALTDLGTKFQATLDRAVQVLERLEKKLSTEGVTIRL